MEGGMVERGKGKWGGRKKGRKVERWKGGRWKGRQVEGGKVYYTLLYYTILYHTIVYYSILYCSISNIRIQQRLLANDVPGDTHKPNINFQVICTTYYVIVNNTFRDMLSIIY